jgi:hypothetical protein
MIGRRAALAGLVALAACAEGRHRLSTLYLGRGIPGGGEVSDEALARFVAEEVVPRLPDGFTLIDGTGHWRDRASGETIRERTVILVVLHTPAGRGAIAEIAAAYGRRFGQEAVLRVESPAEAWFQGSARSDGTGTGSIASGRAARSIRDSRARPSDRAVPPDRNAL